MIRLLRTRLHRHELRTRLPFRYGIVTLTELPHVFLEVEAQIDGRPARGIAADHLPPKWFTKDPSRDPRAEIDDMLAVIHHAADLAATLTADTLFAWWWDLFSRMDAWRRAQNIEPLLAQFGTSLVERALLDAFCRDAGQPFHALLHANAFGIDWSRNEPALAHLDWRALHPATPLTQATLRHTVGLVDPLTEADIPASEYLTDGLPQSLAANIRTYGLHHFKLKLSGDAPADLDRLRRIATVITAEAGPDHCFTLDANEQFTHPAALRAFADQIYADPTLTPFFDHLLCIEQPLSRKVALTADQPDIRAAWPRPVPFIIDESDGAWTDLPRALALGYAGVSHKNCKGVFKGLRNACLVAAHRAAAPADRPWLTTGEDLANIGPVALLQDLAVQAALGNATIERNGHHYFAGLAMFATAVSATVLRDHADLYAPDPHHGARLRLTAGRIALDSINRAPFGVASLPVVTSAPASST